MESMCGAVVYHRSGRWVSARTDDPSRLVASIAAVIASGSEFIGDGIEVIDSQRGTATKGGVTLDPRPARQRPLIGVSITKTKQY